MKTLKLWNSGILQGIMKEQHPRGLIAKNKHSKALMTPYRNPSKFDSVHNFRNQSQI